MFLARVFITFKPTVNDPEGQTILSGLQDMGVDTVISVRAGKYMEVRLEANTESAAAETVGEMCDKLLANPVIEEYRFEIEPVEDE